MQQLFKCTKIIIMLFALTNSSYAQQLATNPLLIHSNKPIRFDKVSVAIIHEAAKLVLAETDRMINKITTVPPNGHTYSNTLKAYDELLYSLNNVNGRFWLIALAYSNDSLRYAASEEKNKILSYIDNINLNEGLYKAIKLYAATKGAKQLHPNQQKFLGEAILSFEKNGMKLDVAKRKQLEIVNEQIQYYITLFGNNINAYEYKDSLELTRQDLNGFDSNKINQWKTPDGKYVVSMDKVYSDMSGSAESETLMRIVDAHAPSPAYPENIKVLDSLLYYRQKMATLLGYRSYAAYAFEDKMAATPANAWKLLKGLVPQLTEKAAEELKMITSLKHQLRPDLPDTITIWDVDFYKNKLTDTKFQYNSQEAKEYFELNNTVNAMFGLFEKLFDIRIKEITNVPVWDPEVKYYELYSDGKKAGSFYMDLYHRQNKSKGGGNAPISYYNIKNGKEILTVSAILTNFTESSTNHLVLLYPDEVTTIFHEFGHLLRTILSRLDISSQTGESSKADFVETPSQFLENWSVQYESLKLISRHYKTGESMPEELFNKMINTNKFIRGYMNLKGVNDCLVDLTFHDKYDSIKGMDLTEVAKRMEMGAVTNYSDNGRFIASFRHLGTYGANYYGYIWSRVFALDMFSVFEKNGIMDSKTGIRYKRTILEKGSSEEEMDMVRKFLGREPNSDAYMKSIGLK